MDEQQLLNLLIGVLGFNWDTALSLVNDTILLYLFYRVYRTNKELKKKVDSLDQLSRELQVIKGKHDLLETKLGELSPSLEKSEQLQSSIPEEKKTEKLESFVDSNKVIPISPEKKHSAFFGGLKKTREFFFSKLSLLSGKDRELNEKTLDELEELLISADLGVKTSLKLLAQLKEEVKLSGAKENFDLKAHLKKQLSDILQDGELSRQIIPQKVNNSPFVILVVGVNGVGKTTTIGKLAAKFSRSGLKVLLGAADTFRAAAVEQIEVWAERANVELYSGRDGAKPATVAYEALKKAQDENFDVVIIDTAGRLHTKVNLMNELAGVLSVIEKLQPGAPQETIIVVDAATGQNALEQAREFNQKAKLSGVIVTKLDGTPKGGIVIAIKDELGIPIRYVGVGEGVDDLREFSAQEFVDALFEEENNSYSPVANKSELRARRTVERG